MVRKRNICADVGGVSTVAWRDNPWTANGSDDEALSACSKHAMVKRDN